MKQFHQNRPKNTIVSPLVSHKENFIAAFHSLATRETRRQSRFADLFRRKFVSSPGEEKEFCLRTDGNDLYSSFPPFLNYSFARSAFVRGQMEFWWNRGGGLTRRLGKIEGSKLAILLPRIPGYWIGKDNEDTWISRVYFISRNDNLILIILN